MGGHAAWRKRLERGELAKGSGGAICRHRPHFGRKGKDLIKNRKGYIGGGNPKKNKVTRRGKNTSGSKDDLSDRCKHGDNSTIILLLVVLLVVLISGGVVVFLVYVRIS